MGNHIEKRLDIIEGILGVDPLMMESYQENPGVCEGSCTDTACPLLHNSLRTARLDMVGLIHEQLEMRCWAEELEASGCVPPGTWERGLLRARLVRLEEQLRQLHNARKQGTLPSQMVGKMQQSVDTLQREAQALRQQLGETKSC